MDYKELKNELEKEIVQAITKFEELSKLEISVLNVDIHKTIYQPLPDGFLLKENREIKVSVNIKI